MLNIWKNMKHGKPFPSPGKMLKVRCQKVVAKFSFVQFSSFSIFIFQKKSLDYLDLLKHFHSTDP